MLPSDETARVARLRPPLLPPLTAAATIVAALGVLAIGALSWQAVSTRSEAVQRLTHSFEVVERLEALLSRARDAETGQRGYVITGEEAYLAPYDEARRRIDADTASLRRLVADAPTQLRRLDTTEQLLKEKVAELQATIEIRRGNPQAAAAVVRSNIGKGLMDRLRAVIGEAVAEERALLSVREAEHERAAATVGAFTIGGSTIVFALVLALAFVASRDFRAREVEAWLRRAEARLAVEMQGDQKLEQLGEKVLRTLIDCVGAPVGALYIAEAGGSLRRLSGYALAPEAAARATIRSGEGVAGQAHRDERLLYVRDVPDGSLRFHSTFGGGAPRHVVAAPLRVDGAVNAVVELGLLVPATEADLELLRRIAGPVGLGIRVAQDRLRVETLLADTQRQAAALQSQQAELEAQQAEVEATNEVLNQTNALMEVQTQELERQRDDLRRARDAADKASRYKSEFLANMSHELRTPLNSSLILARLLADNKEKNLTADQVRSAETIYGAGNDLLALINDILDLAKIEAGRADIAPEPVPLARLSETLERGFRPLASEKRVAFRITRASGCPDRVVTDPRRLEQILKNLLSNAFKFTTVGDVELTMTAESESRVRFAVRDTGIGIPPDRQAVIFEAFRQADGTTSRKYGGTGLGLSISRELAHLLGGEIHLASRVGEGSTFSLILPIELALPRDAPAPPAEKPRSSEPLARRPAPYTFPDDRHALARTGRLILVVEDDAAFARVLFDLAHELDFDCVIASTSEDALTLARDLQPSGILLDVGLTDVSGLSVLERLKRDPMTRHLAVHMVSASDNVQTALELGAIGYALKPVAREGLVAAIEKLEERHARAVSRLLIVDDDARQQESLEALLGGAGVEIVRAGTLEEALAQLEKRSFDCMVLDLGLPDGSGHELLERMAEGQRYSFPPVIVYTGRELERSDEERLRRYSRSIIVKGARSPERLLDEVTLFLHQVESRLPPEQRRILAEARSRDAAFEGQRILLVEDDVRNVFALSKVLEPLGARIEIARNGREALDVLGKVVRVDLVLMDLMMPEMDGLTAIREIRKNGAWKRLPIIALTAKAMADDREQALAAGASDYMAKPFEVDKLVSLCRVWLPRRLA